jgi:hypothetical protein
MCFFFDVRRRGRVAGALSAVVMAAALAGAVSGSSGKAKAAESWTTYKNSRFGYSLSYPSSVFKPQPPNENGDGQSFLSGDGKSKIAVYGTVNDEHFTPAQYRETILKEFAGYNQIDYSPKGKTWFVLSGIRGDMIYYQKVMFSCRDNVINALSVTFPRAEKKFYEGLVEVMEDNVRPGVGEGCKRG